MKEYQFCRLEFHASSSSKRLGLFQVRPVESLSEQGRKSPPTSAGFFFLALLLQRRLKLITARSSSDFALCGGAISMALEKHASARLGRSGVRGGGSETETWNLKLENC